MHLHEGQLKDLYILLGLKEPRTFFWFVVFFFFPFFSSTSSLFFFGPFITSGALIDTLPFKIFVSHLVLTRETTQGSTCLWFSVVYASWSNLSIAFSRSSRRSFETEHFNARDVACSPRQKVFDSHLILQGCNPPIPPHQHIR